MARAARPKFSDDMIEAQQLAKKQGKIRFAGVSTHGGQQQLLPWLAQKGVFDVVLTAYNFSMDPSMEQAIAAAAKAGMGVVAMKVMAGGFRGLKPGDPALQEVEAGRRHAGGAEVGHQQAQRLHHHSQHDGHGPVGGEPEGHGASLLRRRRKAAGRASGGDPPALLPHVRPVRGRLPKGPAGGRCVALPHLRRRLWPVRAGAGEISGVDAGSRLPSAAATAPNAR